MREGKCCGTCRWHGIDMDGEWYCVCMYGEYGGYITGYKDCCDDWEECDDKRGNNSGINRRRIKQFSGNVGRT